MKKIITLLSLFTGIVSNAQYIEPTRFEVEVNAGYSVGSGFSVGKNSDDISYLDSYYSGFLIEGSVFYRTGFDSRYLLGIKANHVNGKASTLKINFIGSDFDMLNREGELLFLGPSLRREFHNRVGTISGSTTFTPGLFLFQDNISGSTSGKVKSTGYAFEIAGSTSYSIYKGLQVFTNLGLNLGYLPNYKFDIKDESFIADLNYQKEMVMRFNLSLGLRYKL